MHFTLYQGYVSNTNTLMSKIQSLSSAGGSVELSELRRRLGWEFDGMRLHEYYFDNLGGKADIDTKGALYKALEKQFSSYEAWKKDFQTAGAMRGIGWVVLYLDTKTSTLINMWIGEHDIGHMAGGIPILVMDVFEHAYITQYGLNRAGYIDTFFKNIQWQVAEKRLEEALLTGKGR
jgi:Fe-Mn family superoxide dismutase